MGVRPFRLSRTYRLRLFTQIANGNCKASHSRGRSGSWNVDKKVFSLSKTFRLQTWVWPSGSSPRGYTARAQYPIWTVLEGIWGVGSPWRLPINCAEQSVTSAMTNCNPLSTPGWEAANHFWVHLTCHNTVDPDCKSGTERVTFDLKRKRSPRASSMDPMVE